MSEEQSPVLCLGYVKEHSDLLHKLDKAVFGNGKPGLQAEVMKTNLALYGNQELKIPGVISNQQLILGVTKQIEPFIPYMRPLIIISFAACSIIVLKFIGLDSLQDIIRIFRG